MPGKLELGGEKSGVRFDEGITLVLDEFRRNRLAIVFGQTRAMIEQVQLTGAAGLKQVNDAFGARRKLRRMRSQRVFSRCGIEVVAAQQ